MIWGMTLEPGKLYTEVIGDEVHLSMASLESRKDFAPEGEKPEGTCHIIMKTEKSEYLLCTLANGVIYQQSLDLKLMPREKVTFSVQGSNMVYLTGYSTSYPDMDDHYEGESETGEWEPYDTGGDMTLNSEELNEMSALEEQEGTEEPLPGEVSVKAEVNPPSDQSPSDNTPQQADQQQQLPMDTPEMTDQPPLQPKQEPTDESDQQEMIFSIAELEANVKQEPQEMQDDTTIILEDDDEEEQRIPPGDHHAQQQQQQQIHEQQQLQELQSQLQQHSNQLQQQQQSNQYIQQQQQAHVMQQRAAPMRTRGYPPVRQRTRGRPAGSYGRGRPRLPQQTFQQNQPSGSSYPEMMAAQGSPRMPVAGYQGATAMQQNVAQAPMQDQTMLNQPGSSRQAAPGPSTSSLKQHTVYVSPVPRIGSRRQEIRKSCLYCQKLFPTGWQCKRHERIHTGAKPFACRYCPKAFRYADRKREHEKVHLTGNQDLQSCPDCGEIFDCSSNTSRAKHLSQCRKKSN